MEKLEHLHIFGGIPNNAATMENNMEISPKIKIVLPYDPAIPLLRIDITISKDITLIFGAVIIAITKKWKKSNVHYWVKKCSIYT